MKKVLFASTALVASAGFAAAEISITGSAEMGVLGGDAYATTQFHTDVEIVFRGTGTTDNGLTFGVQVDLDEAVTAASNTDDGGSFVYLNGGFGNLTMGDTDGALDWALTEAGNVGNPGSIADDETSHAGYLGSYGDGAYDGQILRYDNTFGDFGFAISYEIDDSDAQDNGYAIGARYNADLGGVNLAFGLGYQTFTTTGAWLPGNMTAANIGPVAAGQEIDIIGASVSATFGGGFQAGIEYSQFDLANSTNDFDHIGVGVGYSSGAFGVHANYGRYDGDITGRWDVTGYGLAASYDLGGGASAHLGYGTHEYFNNGNVDRWSLGLAMSF